jgi:hypothetical protein
MSVLQELHDRNIVHAVIRNEVQGMVDWFVVCRKAHIRKIYYTPTGIYIHNKVQIFEIDMTKNDVHYFFESVHRGMYRMAYKELEGIVWEQVEQGFKDYIKRVPMRKNKKL